MIQLTGLYPNHPAVVEERRHDEVLIAPMTCVDYDNLTYATKRRADNKAPREDGGTYNHLHLVFVQDQELEERARTQHGGIMCLPYATIIS